MLMMSQFELAKRKLLGNRNFHSSLIKKNCEQLRLGKIPESHFKPFANFNRGSFDLDKTNIFVRLWLIFAEASSKIQVLLFIIRMSGSKQITRFAGFKPSSNLISINLHLEFLVKHF